MKKGQIREAAMNLLEKAGVIAPPIDVVAIAHILQADVRFASLDDAVSGMLVQEKGRTIIGVNATHHEVRQRFTIAHELGHLTLHSDQKFYVDHSFAIRMRDGKSSLAVDPDEIEANSFAAEILMPAHMLREDIRDLSIDYESDSAISALASRYKVSVQAMTFRLTNLGFIESQW